MTGYKSQVTECKNLAKCCVTTRLFEIFIGPRDLSMAPPEYIMIGLPNTSLITEQGPF